MMQTVASEYRWVKPKWSKLDFELRDGENMVATLNWHKRSSVLAQWSGQQYRFGSEGGRHGGILIQDTTSATPETIATFGGREAKNMLFFADGRTFRWQKLKWWTNEHIWVDGNVTEVVRFSPAVWRPLVTVSIAPSAAAQSELPLLILFGQYLVARAAQDDETATTAAMVAVMGGST